MENAEKRCSSCGETKAASEFYKWGKRGLAAYCKFCERQKKYGISPNTPIRNRAVPALAPDGMKHCYACGADKPATEFAKDRQKADGLDAYCKPCRIVKSRQSDLKPRPFDPDFKRCEHCGEVKPTADFHKASTQFDGRSKICKACALAWKQENPMSRINAVLKYKYRAPHGTFERLFAEQGGKCAICGDSAEGAGQDRLALDHCHMTGALRGLLCRSCNLGLGFLRDSEKNLSAAIEYLRKHR